MRLARSKVHFIGIGGIGMCGLAELLHSMGAKVTGSDLAENTQTSRLKSLGISVLIGQRAENIGEADVVVYSSAVKPNNPEYAEARRKRVPLIPRAEALAEMMLLKRGIAIGGSHGKTTTTSFTASIFMEAQLKPTIVVGGRLDAIQSTALLGGGEWLIAESDESDGSFLRLSPEIVVITNIDNDHLDHYGTMEQLKKAFLDFASRVPFYGLVIACGDDPNVRETFKDFAKNIVYYGFNSDNDVVLSGEGGHYQLSRHGKVLGKVQVPLAGKHNALNAAAAMMAGLEAGIPFETVARGVAQFRGVDRRFQFKGAARGIDIYDDYGHHPTEIEATLQACKEKFPQRRLVVAFQPHRYSRTLLCWDQFKTCFDRADRLFLTDIYAAGEAPITGVNSERLAQEVSNSNVSVLSPVEKSEVLNAARTKEFLSELREGDVVLTLGAGDITKLGPLLLEAISSGKKS